MIQIAVLGYGTVGSGVVEVINTNHESINKRVGQEVNIKYVLDLRDFPGDPVEKVLVHDYETIINDPEVDIVVEVMGGVEPAYTFTKRALQAGKSVCTSNKELVARHGLELLKIAEEKNINYMFEASCGGGIPIIRPLKQCLAANHITEIMGIVNGTTNFILTKMTQEGMEFAQALALATELGYAEADPTADIQGLDAGRKMAIMASIAFNSRVTFDDVITEGITQISAKDIRYAKELGCVIKLLGVARNTENGIEVSVRPMLIPETHALATVNDSFNAVFLTGDAVGDAMFYGRGAGELPTASAIAGDVFDVARNIVFECTGRIGCTCYKQLPLKAADEMESRFFLRMHVSDCAGTLASIASVFGNNNVSIAQVIQKNKEGELAELVVVTSKVKEGNFNDAMMIIEGMSVVQKVSKVIRVYGD